MKKTLITLAALAASVASAAVSTNSYTAADFSNGQLTLDTALDYSQDWTLTLNVTVGQGYASGWGSAMLASGSDANPDKNAGGFQLYAAIKNHGDADHTWGGIVDLDDNGNPISTGVTYKINASQDSDKVTKSDQLLATGSVWTFVVNFDSESSVLSSYGYTGEAPSAAAISSMAVTSTVADANKSDITTLSTALTGLEGWSINSITTSVGTPDTSAVPEPTTATLSLLALAGLAARRRRK